MFSVTRDGNGFRIRLKDGRRGGYHALSIDEIIKAVGHYYATPLHQAQVSGCPLCRALALSRP